MAKVWLWLGPTKIVCGPTYVVTMGVTAVTEEPVWTVFVMLLTNVWLLLNCVGPVNDIAPAPLRTLFAWATVVVIEASVKATLYV